MAHIHPSRVGARPSLLKQFVNFTNSSAGLEKTLRLIHALCIIAAEVCMDSVTIKRYLIAQSQLALARRYFRLFCFFGCFESASESLTADSRSPLAMLEVTKHACLGFYSLLEDLTMLHDMNVWLVPWYTPVLIEANKFWFYAICISVAEAIMGLLFRSTTLSNVQDNGAGTQDKRKEAKTRSSKPLPSTVSLLKVIVADGCDLALPGYFLGWLPVSTLAVGMAMVVSTVTSSIDIWEDATMKAV